MNAIAGAGRLDANASAPVIERPLVLAALGLLAGLSSGFLGIGGGLIIVPGLMLLFGYPIKRAAGVSLATVVLVSLIGVVVEVAVKRSNIYWTMALVLTLGSLVGSAVAGRLLPRLPERALRVVFAGCLGVASYRMVTGGVLGADGGVMTLGDGSPLAYLAAVPIGVIAGLTSTLFGIGGGIVTVPCLSLLFRDVSFHAARATSLTAILPTSAFGAWQHQRLGTVDFAVVRGLVPSALVGSGIGVLFVNILPPRPGRFVFGIFLALVAARLLFTERARTSSPAVLATNPPRVPGVG